MPSETGVFDEQTEAAIKKSGRDPLSLSAVFETAIHKGASVDEAADLEFQNVFGVGAKRDSKGSPIEQGKGSKVQQTSQHLAAQQKWEGRG